MTDEIAASISRVDIQDVARTYRRSGHIVLLDGMFSGGALAVFERELSRLRAEAHWRWVPRVRKGGVVGYRILQRQARAMVALYQSHVFVSWLSRIVGRDLLLKSENDEHACSIYWYRRPGDHVRYHYDSCGCGDEGSFTALFGLIDQCSNHLEYQVKRAHGGLATPKRVTIAPGSLLVFNGSTVFHRVTPLGMNEERAILSLSYTTQSRMSRRERWQENLKDGLVYFGLPAIVQRNYGEVLGPPALSGEDE